MPQKTTSKLAVSKPLSSGRCIPWRPEILRFQEGYKPHVGRKTAEVQVENLLEVNNIEVIYNHVILVLKGVSLNVPKGGITALLGGNGAGKTTTLKAISGLLASERGEVTKGSIKYRGEAIQDQDPAETVKKGVVQVMEGRHCFEHLTVEENLMTGAYTRTDGKARSR